MVAPATPREATHSSARWKAITKSDSVNITNNLGNEEIPRAVWVGGAGVVAAVDVNGNVTNFTAVAGSVLPISPYRVNSTNTTATLLVALF